MWTDGYMAETVIGLVLATVGFGLVLAWAVRGGRIHPGRLRYGCTLLLWLAHTMVYYAVMVMRDNGQVGDSDLFSWWSLIVRLQALVSIIGVMGCLIMEDLVPRNGVYLGK